MNDIKTDIETIKMNIANAEVSTNKLKQRREKYIETMNSISNNIQLITDQITHAELQIEYSKDELKKFEEKLSKENKQDVP